MALSSQLVIGIMMWLAIETIHAAWVTRAQFVVLLLFESHCLPSQWVQLVVAVVVLHTRMRNHDVAAGWLVVVWLLATRDYASWVTTRAHRSLLFCFSSLGIVCCHKDSSGSRNHDVAAWLETTTMQHEWQEHSLWYFLFVLDWVLFCCCHCTSKKMNF
jgi:hypothetical protein